MDELTLPNPADSGSAAADRRKSTAEKQDETPVFFSEMIGKSKKCADLPVYQKASENDATVLVRGESGTGKELVAHAIHGSSQRKNKPFVTVNCARTTGEFVGKRTVRFRKGAFTGAMHRRIGKFEQAGGAVFSG